MPSGPVGDNGIADAARPLVGAQARETLGV
jgi:hypothetical protein